MSYYPYRTILQIDQQPCDVAVLYKYANGDYTPQLSEVIDRLLNRRIPPHRILFVCPKGQEQHVLEEYTKLDEGTKARISGVTHVTLVAFDCQGRIDSIVNLQSQDSWVLTDSDIETVVHDGMSDIIDTTGTKMEAPNGYMFRKPSENTNQAFIRAGNMIKDPAALAVIFHAMVRTIPRIIKRLYIDSSTILAIALHYNQSMQQLAAAYGESWHPVTITNFRSYNIDTKFETPPEYTILISATTSGGLAKKLIAKHSAQLGTIYHLLTFSENNALSQSSVYFRQVAPTEKVTENLSQKFITIPGEEFLASHGPTQTVDLVKAHFEGRGRDIYIDPFYQTALELNLTEAGQYGGALQLITLNLEKDIGSKKFKEWLKKKAEIEIPRNTSLIVACDTPASKRLAEELKALLPGDESKKIPIITPNKLSGQSKHKTVLVVCASERDGDSLVSISQALRDVEHEHRHYIVGHLYPSNIRQYKRLVSNLRIGSRDNYGYSDYYVIPMGENDIHASWMLEDKFDYSNIDLPDRSKLAAALKNRADALENSPLCKDILFLPTMSGDALCLRPDSVLFIEGYEYISQVTVYIQVAAALQRARDKESLEKSALRAEQCFQNNPFIDTVIDPNTFSRYNDGVIQAAILRAAQSFELNYSRDLKLSKDMSDIIKDTLASRELKRGEAALEFMFALKTEKVRLHKEHQEKVVQYVEATPELHTLWKLFENNSPI